MRRTRLVLVLGAALVLVAGLAAVGVGVWHRAQRTTLDEALRRVPASSLRVAFTDWSQVRAALRADLGSNPSSDRIEKFIGAAYDSDLSAASSIEEAAVALQENFGFSPANAQWEALAQGRRGATMVLKVADGTDFGILADNLRTIGFRAPRSDTGVWRGGSDLIAGLDPTISPELQYVVLLEDQGLVVTSDTASYAASSARAAAGDADSLGDTDRVDGLAEGMGATASALVWSGDFACADLAMSRTDDSDQARASELVEAAGGVTPLTGLAMGMRSDRRLRVVERFEDDGAARDNVRARARLVAGEAVGRGGSFSDSLRLTRARTEGASVVLDLRPRQRTGYVLSAVDSGPVLFATC